MAVNTLSSNFANDVSTYIAAKLLLLAKKSLTLYQLCDHSMLPHNEGRTIQYTRYERVALPQSTLTEGVTPADTSMSISVVTATMDQWGAVIPISDVAIDSVKHPVLQQAIQLAALQAKETMDREISKVLLTGTNVFFPNAITDRSSLTTSDTVDGAALGKMLSSLRSDGAMPREDGMYVGACHPYAEEDIVQDTKFVEVARYNNSVKLFNQEIGTWKGTRWIRSNFLPFLSLTTGGSGATSATNGSLVASTAYDFKYSIVDASTGFETHMSAKVDVSTGAGDTSIDFTFPALPSNATAGSTFKLYAGSDAGTLYLSSSGNAASSTVNVSTIPTSGDVAQDDPPASLTVYFLWIFGRQGAICTELNKIRSYLTPAVPSDSDPLVQRRKVGWKLDFKTVISNENFLARLEHVTTSGDL